jgi:hypothetical protein
MIELDIESAPKVSFPLSFSKKLAQVIFFFCSTLPEFENCLPPNFLTGLEICIIKF